MAQIFPLVNPGQVNFPTNQNVTVTNTPTTQPEGQDAAGNLHSLATDAQGRVVISAQPLIELLQQLVLEVRAMKAAIISLDSSLLASDFDATDFDDDGTA
jgi:hypothetical protein